MAPIPACSESPRTSYNALSGQSGREQIDSISWSKFEPILLLLSLEVIEATDLGIPFVGDAHVDLEVNEWWRVAAIGLGGNRLSLSDYPDESITISCLMIQDGPSAFHDAPGVAGAVEVGQSLKILALLESSPSPVAHLLNLLGAASAMNFGFQ